MVNKFIEAVNNFEKCICCVENVGYCDTEYNTYSNSGAWVDGNGVRLSFNDGNTEIYLDDWDDLLVYPDDDNENIDDITDGCDSRLVYEFVFGNVKRKFIFF